MTALGVYLWLMLDNLIALFVVIAIFSLAVSMFLAVVVYIEEEHRFKPALKKSFIIGCIFTMLFVFTPSSKQFALIYVLPKLSKSEYVKQISSLGKKDLKLLLELADKELQRRIEQLDKGKKER